MAYNLVGTGVLDCPRYVCTNLRLRTRRERNTQQASPRGRGGTRTRDGEGALSLDCVGSSPKGRAFLAATHLDKSTASNVGANIVRPRACNARPYGYRIMFRQALRVSSWSRRRTKPKATLPLGNPSLYAPRRALRHIMTSEGAYKKFPYQTRARSV